MHRNRKLRNYFIYPEFQFKFILLIMAISLVAPVILLGFQLNLFRTQIQNGQMMNLPPTHPYFVFYDLFQSQSLLMFAVAVGISFVMSIVLGIFVSHRVAGPMVKLKKHFEVIAQDKKNDAPVNFRENDFFKEVAEAYNLKFKNR